MYYVKCLCNYLYFVYTEYEELKGYLHMYKVYRYKPSKEVKKKYKDGGVAIIDQWICAHAR